MPHKANAACRHHIPRAKRRVTNWAAHDAALRQRGSLTAWFREGLPAATTPQITVQDLNRELTTDQIGRAHV